MGAVAGAMPGEADRAVAPEAALHMFREPRQKAAASGAELQVTESGPVTFPLISGGVGWSR